MTMTDALTEIRDRRAKATPGNWVRRDTPDYAEIVSEERVQPVALVGHQNDADFIAHAPTDIALLLARIAGQDKRIAELEAMVRRGAELINNFNSLARTRQDGGLGQHSPSGRPHTLRYREPGMNEAIGTGRNFAVLGNAISDAIHSALQRGMEIDEAVCCAAAVAADYARAEYGKDYLTRLASVVIERGDMPEPQP